MVDRNFHLAPDPVTCHSALGASFVAQSAALKAIACLQIIAAVKRVETWAILYSLGNLPLVLRSLVKLTFFGLEMKVSGKRKM